MKKFTRREALSVLITAPLGGVLCSGGRIPVPEKDRINEKLCELITEAPLKESAVVTINGNGLEADLEGFMWEILQSIQERATETAVEFVLGESKGQ